MVYTNCVMICFLNCCSLIQSRTHRGKCCTVLNLSGQYMIYRNGYMLEYNKGYGLERLIVFFVYSDRNLTHLFALYLNFLCYGRGVCLFGKNHLYRQNIALYGMFCYIYSYFWIVWNQVEKGCMPVGLHYIFRTLIWESGYLFSAHNTSKI